MSNDGKWATGLSAPFGRAAARGGDIFSRRKIQIAKQTLLMHNAAVGVMGGPSKQEARDTLRDAGWSDAKIQALEKSGTPRHDIEASVQKVAYEGMEHLDDAGVELVLFLENDPEMYRQQDAVVKNLVRKMRGGRYDHALAPKLWQYWVDAGAKRYLHEFDAPSARIQDVFPIQTRQQVAQYFADQFRDEAELGNYGDVGEFGQGAKEAALEDQMVLPGMDRTPEYTMTLTYGTYSEAKRPPYSKKPWIEIVNVSVEPKIWRQFQDWVYHALIDSIITVDETAARSWFDLHKLDARDFADILGSAEDLGLVPVLDKTSGRLLHTVADAHEIGRDLGGTKGIMAAKSPVEMADRQGFKMTALYIGDGYLAGASTDGMADSIDYWPGSMWEDGEWELVELNNVPSDLARQLEAMGTGDQEFPDGYAAASAAADYAGGVIESGGPDQDDESDDELVEDEMLDEDEEGGGAEEALEHKLPFTKESSQVESQLQDFVEVVASIPGAEVVPSRGSDGVALTIKVAGRDIGWIKVAGRSVVMASALDGLFNYEVVASPNQARRRVIELVRSLA
jgi:hypothetical protein